MKIAGSNILVTGASSGIGAELAPQLAKAGATVGIVARRAERLERVLERCRAHSPDSRMWAADLGDLERAEQVAIEAWDAFGHLDCLVNNAAIPKRTPLTRLTPADVEYVMDVDFHSPMRMGMAVLPRMLERGSGEIVNVSSLGGRLGIAHEAAYCAAKFALCGWSEVMAIDLHGTGVSVKLVLPGPIETEIWDQPDNDPALYDGPFVPAAECAASIVRAIESDGFEYYAPAEMPGGLGTQHEIVNVSSLCGRLGIAHEAAYCAAKFALCGWSEVMAIDLHGTGVSVKLVLPGPIETEIWDQPDNDPALYDGPFVPVGECATSIVRAIEGDGFEYYAPAEMPGGLGTQHEIVVGKTQDPGAFLSVVAEMAKGSAG